MLTLTANKRQIKGKQVKKIRQEGLIPAILYGPELENIDIQVPEKDFYTVFKEAGESEILLLKIEDLEKEFTVLIKDIQRDPIEGKITHVDFYHPKAGEKIEVKVPLEFVGEAPASRKGGVIVKVLHELEVECFPRDIPRKIEVDLSQLEDIDSQILIKDLPIPKGVDPLLDLDTVVVAVSLPEKEEAVEEAGESEGGVLENAQEKSPQGNEES